MILRPWPRIGGAIQSILDDIRNALLGLSPIVNLPLTSGTESQFEYFGSKPQGFIPIKAVDTTGAGLTITSWAFNPSPSKGRGWYGVTVTVASGTIATVSGQLVGG